VRGVHICWLQHEGHECVLLCHCAGSALSRSTPCWTPAAGPSAGPPMVTLPPRWVGGHVRAAYLARACAHGVHQTMQCCSAWGRWSPSVPALCQNMLARRGGNQGMRGGGVKSLVRVPSIEIPRGRCVPCPCLSGCDA